MGTCTPWSCDITLPAQPISASRPRDFVRHHLAVHGLSHPNDDLGLVFGELTSNAVLHAHTFEEPPLLDVQDGSRTGPDRSRSRPRPSTRTAPARPRRPCPTRSRIQPSHLERRPRRTTTTRRTRDMERIARVLRRLVSQDIARRNASQASATLRKRRYEQEDVDAYLEALPRTSSTSVPDVHGSPSSARGTSPIADVR